MPTFTPPTVKDHSEDWFFGRFGIPAGISVVWDGTGFVARPYTWLGEIRPPGGTDLVEGVTWFQGGRTYQIDDATQGLLQNAGFVTDSIGYGEGAYGISGYGGSL